MMEKFEQQPQLNVKDFLEQIPGVSEVKKLELDEIYFDWAKINLSPELYKTIQDNYESVDSYKYQYLSDNLLIPGFIWTPKEIKEKLPLVIWNRGGSRTFSSIGQKRGRAYSDIPCEITKNGAIVMASEYRGGFNSEGQDEWGGADLRDVIRIKEIADQLLICKPGKVIVAGASRGGMMSYLLASKEPWVKAVIALAGTADLVAMSKERPEMYKVFKDCFGGSDEEMKKRSATEFYSKIPKDLPLLILQGSEDTRVPVEQVRRLNNLLQASGHKVEYNEFPGADHFFYTPESAYREKALEIINQFLNKHLDE